MADAFDELAGLYFKEGSKAGGVYKKVRVLCRSFDITILGSHHACSRVEELLYLCNPRPVWVLLPTTLLVQQCQWVSYLTELWNVARVRARLEQWAGMLVWRDVAHRRFLTTPIIDPFAAHF